MESSSISTEMQDVFDYSFPPPVGVVVVRGTPPLVLNSSFNGAESSIATTSASRKSPSNATPNFSCVNSRAPSYSFSSAFRLQPRGCGNTILPIPSPAHNPTCGGLFSERTSSGGRKRGASCLASACAPSFGVPRRALFPSKNAATPVVVAAASSSTASSTASLMSPAPWSPEGSASGALVAAASPGRVGDALQTLSLKSPIRTPQERQLCWKGRESSPFHLYASPPPQTSHPDGPFFYGRGRGESISSVASVSSARTLGSSSRCSPRHAPVLVIQKEGQEEKNSLSPLHRRDSSYVVSLDNKRAILESPSLSRTPKVNSPPEVLKMPVGTPETHPCTPRLHDVHETLSTPHKQGKTATSRMIGFPSPHETPLPRIKLTPRRSGGNDPSTPASMKCSSQDLDLLLSPASAGVFELSTGPISRGGDMSSSKFEPPSPQQRNIIPRIRTAPSYAPLPFWSDSYYPSPCKFSLPLSQKPPTNEGNTSLGERPAVLIRSLLGPCDARPSPSLQAMVTAEAEAAALDCDGSLTDDDDDGEPFVLTDPAILVAECHERSDQDRRPSRRRRTSMEKEENPDVMVVDEPLRSFLATTAAPPALSVYQSSSSTSPVGLAFLRGDSMTSFGNSQSLLQLCNFRLDSSGSSESSNSTTEEIPRVCVNDSDINRVRSKESLNSIGLDLEPSSSDSKELGNPKSTTAQISGRDLHTPPAMQDGPTTESPQLLGRSLRHRSSGKYHGREGRGPASVYLSRADPGNVHRTIASLVAQEQQQSPSMI
jgi:hypothetical protein